MKRRKRHRKNTNTIYLKKSELDQFYTAEDVAKNCYSKVVGMYDPKKFTRFFEPCAGTGSFYNLFPKSKRAGIDLDPKCDGVDKQDFFEYEPPIGEKIATISNPPFGKNSSLAIKFFNTAAKFSEVIAFIVPKTFKKQSVQNKLSLDFHLVLSEDLPKDSFVLDGEPYNVPCCFQIWERRPLKREKKIVDIENDLFSFVSKNEADFAVRRVGGRTGKCQADLAKAAEVSHYFLKIKKRTVKKSDLISMIDSLNVTEIINATAGVKSLSKQEFVEAFFNTYKGSV